jgi:hypothetical protein
MFTISVEREGEIHRKKYKKMGDLRVKGKNYADR